MTRGSVDALFLSEGRPPAVPAEGEEGEEDAMIDDPSDTVPSRTGDPDPAEDANVSKDPKDWVTGDAPMTEAQASYLKALCAEAGAEFDPGLTQAGAAELIDQLKAEVPRLAATEGDPGH